MSTDPRSGLDARDDLLWIAHHWTALRAALVGTGGNALTGLPGVAMTSGSTVIDIYVSDLLHEVTENVARYYARVLMHETEWEPRTSAMPALLVEVASRYGHFTTDDQMATGFMDDAHDYRERVRKALERPAPPVYIGPCQTANCEGELYVREDRDHTTCPNCGKTTTVIEQRAWLDGEMEARLMTMSELASALVVLDLKVPIGTIKSWVARKKLMEAAPDSGLYRLADAKELATRRRAA